VLATDPESGEQVAKEVINVWVHDDTLVDLILDGEAITTTEDHPFFNVTDGDFQWASQITPGDQVLTDNGRLVTVHGIDTTTAHDALAYNLTVQGIHTYHVGQDHILVHNTETCPTPLSREAKDQLRAEARDIWQARTGRRAIWDTMEVHHRIPLEWSHVMRGTPNRAANLVGMKKLDHQAVSKSWGEWNKAWAARRRLPRIF
jgi:hypothetical protein